MVTKGYVWVAWHVLNKAGAQGQAGAERVGRPCQSQVRADGACFMEMYWVVGGDGLGIRKTTQVGILVGVL